MFWNKATSDKLSKYIKFFAAKIGRTIQEYGRRLGRYLIRQIDFFRQFDYSGQNIRNYFMDKASAFFGVDETKLNGRTKPKDAYFRLINKHKNSRATLKVWTRKAGFEKNMKKNRTNYYRPANELNN